MKAKTGPLVYWQTCLLIMRHQVGGDEGEALRIAHQRLQRGPLGFEVDAVAASRLLHPAGCASLRLSRGIPCRSALLLRQFLAFGDLFELRVQLRQLAGVQAQLGDAALVIDRHRGIVGDGALDACGM